MCLGYYVLYASSKISIPNAFLLFSSLIFYAWGEPRYVLVLTASIVLNYLSALLLDSAGTRNAKPVISRATVLSVGLIANLCLLCYFKYLNFFAENGLLTIINVFLPENQIVSSIHQIALPLGISFFTFQGMSYLIDVYRGQVRATRSILDFACYLAMFPQLVAGPIVRYVSIAQELTWRTISIADVSEGMQRFIWGLAKKLLIADTLSNVADAAFSIPTEQLSPLAAWAGIVCYTLQIYYDFSGYSDMAIGLGKAFGFTFPENFNYPYISRNIREFWRRWHITLSTWFRDYLYIPLGGNRIGKARTALNLLLVFVLCGFWHGAQWSFLAWGLYHGFLLTMERVFPSWPERLPRAVQHGVVLLLLMLGWVFFRADTLGGAWEYCLALTGRYESGVMTNKVWLQLYAGDVYLALVMGILGAMPIYPAVKKYVRKIQEERSWMFASMVQGVWTALTLAIMILCMLPLFGATHSAFIYFRF